MTQGKRKPGLSLERHREIGAELKAINARLQDLACELGNAYPLSSSVARTSWRLGTGFGSGTLSLLRSELENAMFREHAGEAGCSIDVYYG